MKRKRLSPLKRTLLVSVLLHAILLVGLFFWKLDSFPTPFLFSRSFPTKEDAAHKVKQQILPINLVPSVPKQIVSSERGQETLNPDRNAFLGERNQTVTQQTIAFQKKQQPPVSEQKNIAPPFSLTPPLPSLGEASPKRLSGLDLKKWGLPLFPEKQIAGYPEKKSQASRFMASENTSPLFHEYVEGLDPSDRTLLNTQEFVFYGYFQHIRQRLEQVWEPIIHEKLRRRYYQEHELVSERHMEAQLIIYLDPQGTLIRVKVVRTSGVKDLDDSAIQAFHEASPFPQPPKAMIQSQKEIKLLWNFVLRS